jgi:hypothetical protein
MDEFRLFYTIIAVCGDVQEEKVLHHLVIENHQYEFYGKSISLRARIAHVSPLTEQAFILSHTEKRHWRNWMGRHPDSLIAQYTRKPSDILEFGELCGRDDKTRVISRIMAFRHEYVSDYTIWYDLKNILVACYRQIRNDIS